MKPAVLSGLWFLIYVSNVALIQGRWLLQMLLPLKSSFVICSQIDLWVKNLSLFVFGTQGIIG